MLGQDLIASLRLELRRGSVVLICLLALREPEYGYALLKTLEDVGLSVDANTLYPLLRRLEGQGLVTSEWVTDDPRPRKYYRTSPTGEEAVEILIADWDAMDGSVKHLDRRE